MFLERPCAGGVATLGEPAVELTILMPCLNEAETLAACVGEAAAALAAAGVVGEVLVADNGSTDGSQALALAAGARVVDVAGRGYGNALAGGIAAARGRFVLMGDADGSYDFGELPRFLAPLRGGADLVMGCRLPAGGGRILPGAMPWTHRWIGNPILTRPWPPVLHRTQSTTSIAACAPSGATPSWGWGCNARAWSSPRRWWCGRASPAWRWPRCR